MSEWEHVDVLIVGAGLSGVGAAAQLVRERPGTSYAILEARSAMGGTWDLFRYPGVRSDSDMFTLGYRFKPWTDEKALADGPSILAYVQETARGVRRRPPHPLRPRGDVRGLGLRDRALDRHRAARRHRGAAHLPAAVGLQRLLRLRRAGYDARAARA